MNVFFDEEIERRVLGQILINSDCFPSVANIVNSRDFYNEQNKKIFEIVEDLFKLNEAIDILTVTNYCLNHKINTTPSCVASYCEGIISATHVENHARIIKDLSIRRQLVLELRKLKQIGENKSVSLDDFIQRCHSFTENILNSIEGSNRIKPFKENVQEAVRQIQEKQDKKNSGKYGLPPSLEGLRKKIPYWENSELIIIGGRPSMGKTAFAIFEATFIAKHCGPVLIFSLEMGEIQLTNRIIQAESGLTRYDFDKMTQRTWTALDQSIPELLDIPLFIDPTSNLSFAHLKAKIKIFKQQHDLKAVFIDYLQLMDTNNSLTRDRQLAEISRGLKCCAKDFQIPIFLLSQLNRGPDSRPQDFFRPRLSDLKESGAIEQDADIVLFPYRPAYYYPNDPEMANIVELIISKYRNGETGTVLSYVNDSKTKFLDEPPSNFTGDINNKLF